MGADDAWWLGRSQCRTRLHWHLALKARVHRALGGSSVAVMRLLGGRTEGHWEALGVTLELRQ